MIKIIESEFQVLAGEFIVSKTEAEFIADKLKEKLTDERRGKKIRNPGSGS